MKYKSTHLVVVVSVLVLLLQACGKKPVPCFDTYPDKENIHINQQVTFSAYCTNNGNDYYWQFYNNEDSIEFGPVVTKYFKDTGTVKVSLTATNANKSAIYTDYILVRH